ncbi:MAG: right-handed parallel beta-helix repeat-containing protein, partial [Armatimonadetes bacterium]|nr:right-handed parallel beta-helix repeat-containing protein [Armatimonadota bacterium]
MNCRSNPIRAYALLCTALLFAMLVFIAAPVMATTYYVNNDTGVDGNPGTIEAPWKTIDYGDSASLLSSGDTVIVEAGTYVPATANGVWLKNTFASAATPVTYKAQGLVVIDMTSVTGSTHGFTIVADGNVIDGDTVETPPTPSPNRFEIKGASVGVYVGPCYDVTVKNCTIHDGRCSASGDVSVMGLRVDGSTNTTATQNLIYNMHASGEVPWGPLGCGLVTGNATNLVFSNNTVDNVFIGVFYYANPTFALITTQNNIVVNCTGYGFVNPWCTDPSFFVCSNNLLFNDAITYGNFPAGNNAPYPDDVTADPMFRYRTGGDYRLLTGTPAKDAGFSGEFLGAYQGEWPALGIGTLSGKVTANVAGNPPVRGALVQTSDASVSTTTDANGNYSMVVPAASITLNVSAFGFSGASGTTSVPAGSTATLNFSLTLANAAKTYYVNGATGSDTNPGTLASPWKTINNGDVNNILNPGDTVIVSAGTYAQANANGVVIANRRGYSFAPITYKADGAVLIDQSGFVGDAYGFKVSAAGTVIDGFEVKGARVGVRIADGAHDSTVNGCKLHDGQSAGQDSAGVFVALADNVTVTRNVIYKFNDAGNAAWGPVGCGLETDGSVNLKVFNNTIDNCYLGVFYRPAGSITTKNNIVSNCTGWGFVNPWSTDASKFSNGYNLIFNNVVDYGNFPAGNNGPMGGDVSGQDPLFVNSAAGDYSLQNASPALNAGVDVGLPFIGPGPDMGALESSYIPPVHTYYVDNAAGDDTNPGTSALPWKTINNGDVKGILNPGDTVIVNAGTYPQAGAGGVVINKRRGTPIASITYKAQGVVKIDQSSFGSGSYGFQVSVRGITLDGFEIVGAQHGVLLGPGADNALVTNCKIHDYTALLDSTGVYAAQCTDASIIRNFIYNFNNP